MKQTHSEWRVTGRVTGGLSDSSACTNPLHTAAAIDRAIKRLTRDYRGKPMYEDVRVEVREVTEWVIDDRWKKDGK